ncbi:uncharacterized protein LOC124381422 [Silurus meridionalis]|nr:uncharacterized protein LOC124381422 [Silurus meridionalis]
MSVGLKYAYVQELSDPNSKEFHILAVMVIEVLDVIYRTKYGYLFIRTIVISFKGQTKRAGENTTAEVQLVFNENSTTPIPPGEEIVNVLRNVAENNNTFVVQFDTNTITLINEPYIVPVLFRTNGTYVKAFSNSGSDLFTNRTIMIKTGLNPYFVADFTYSFTLLTMSNFSNGGPRENVDTILNYMELNFARSGGIPNNTHIWQTMLRAAQNVSLPFKIYTNDIIVNGTLMSSSGVSSKISVFMACFMVAVSLSFTWTS